MAFRMIVEPTDRWRQAMAGNMALGAGELLSTCAAALRGFLDAGEVATCGPVAAEFLAGAKGDLAERLWETGAGHVLWTFDGDFTRVREVLPALELHEVP
jgi:hypothetical protein